MRLGRTVCVASGIFVSKCEDHALVEEFLERFVGRDEAEVEQDVDACGVRGYGSAIKICEHIFAAFALPLLCQKRL